MVFAPTNSDLQNGDFFYNRDSVMDTGWESVLWWSFGVGVRNGTWSTIDEGVKPSMRSQAPASLLEILDFAKSKGVRLMPYVYPVIVGFTPSHGYGTKVPVDVSSSKHPGGDSANSHSGDDCSAAPWLYPSKNAHIDRLTCHSDLGSPEYQIWLIKALSSFYTLWGEYAGGYAFDGVFLGETHNHTTYAQWRGWANVLEGLKRLHPEMIIDNRLSAHGLGPWHMLAGSYDEPIAGDENPETYGIPVPSLRTDHVAADNLRRVNYWYRHGSLLPMRRIPGFFGHQTDRSRGDLSRPNVPMATCSNMSAGGTMPCYKRDYDLLGYKYALMSQLATSGLNNVVCMIPARDEAEFKLFPTKDTLFIHDWLVWTDSHIKHLKNTIPLLGRDEVAASLVDGTAAFKRPLGCETTETGPLGFVWLFNPGYKPQNATIKFDNSLSPFDACTLDARSASGGFEDSVNGTRTGVASPRRTFVVEQLYPGGTGARRASYGDELTFDLDGSSAIMLQVSYSKNPTDTQPLLFGLSAESVSFTAGGLEITGATDEYGTVVSGATVVLSAGACANVLNLARSSSGLGKINEIAILDTIDCTEVEAGAVVTLPPLRFGGAKAAPFSHAQAVTLTPGPATGDGNATFTGSAVVPSVVFAQLAARAKAYPVIWDARDDDASWLRPERLLLFLHLNCTTGRSGACNDKMFASLNLDGKEVRALRAYESRCVECTNVNHPFDPRASARFNGYYWDVSTVLKPGIEGELELRLPTTYVASVQGLFFEGVEPVVAEASGWA
jgi:hypothetical protein